MGYTMGRRQDSPEVIQMCLNCKKPKCVKDCPELREACHKPRGYVIDGECLTLQEWAVRCGLPVKLLKSRMGHGKTLKQAIMEGERMDGKAVKAHA